MTTTQNPYAVTLRFTKVFLKGHTLEGLTFEDSLGFTTEQSAIEWAHAVNSPKLSRRNRYRVEGCAIVRNH